MAIKYGPITIQDPIPDSVTQEVADKETVERIDALRTYDFNFLTNNFVVSKIRRFSPEQLFPLVPYFRRFKLTVDEDVSVRLGVEFKRFVTVALIYPSRRNAPSGPVDMFWHFFILHTPEYVRFCTEIFGAYGPQPRIGKHYFTDWTDKRAEQNAINNVNDKNGDRPNVDRDAMVDHIPATDETRPAMYKSYQETRKLYTKLFGKPDNRFWPLGGGGTTCGDSYSGFVNPKYKRTPILELSI